MSIKLFITIDYLLIQGSVSKENELNDESSLSRRGELITINQYEFQLCDKNNQENHCEQAQLSFQNNNNNNEMILHETSLEKKVYPDFQSSCGPCNNGDFSTGIHRCLKCNKPVHLFG